ncbi:histidine kinase dimerization/phosphoacceptor domain -containing protein [uncultured Dokdonia sp.]|uniref:tetratricopeptide repeat-containing sensor histidine kinase n=1 Tax=uncultured Dokdonia sp. TaxID=575653 RepID=UPI002604DD79|nr:histidine kinase dimerization/phosphoacceptor domain -containing protein [uncultured Dokdonia sp.]
MHSLSKLILILIISLCTAPIYAQEDTFEQKTDAFLLQIKNISSDAKKVDTLNYTISNYRYNKSTLKLIKKALEISKNARDEEMLSNTYFNYGNYYYYNSKLDSSLYYLELSEENLNDQQELLKASIYMTKSGVFRKSGDISSSINLMFNAQRILDKIDLKKLSSKNILVFNKQKLTLSNSLGNFYNQMEEYEKAIAYYDDGYRIAKQSELYSIAGVFITNKGDLFLKTKKYQEALDFFKEGKLLKSKENVPPRIIANSDLNIGIALSKLQRYEEALKYLDEVIQFYESQKINNKLSESLAYRGDTYLDLQEYDKAKEDCEKSKKIAVENSIVEVITQSCHCLYIAYKNLNDTPKALLNHEIYAQTNDSIFNATNIKKQTQLEMDYEFSKEEELKNIELQAKQRESRLYSYLALAGFLLTLLLGFFYYKNRKKNNLLAKQKILLEATIDDKNALLKETHHRVKNSFQIVSSLLYLQSESIQDKEAQLAIKEAQNRVRSMVLIHQKLYNKDQLVGINTKEYFEDLTQDIFESHQFTKLPINYSLEVASMVLDVETITPIGLILNELITNVLKHAFDEVDAQSNMHIAFEEKEDNLLLKVSDNGKGMCKTIKESSFGIQLIKALSKKLKATLVYSGTEPTGTIATLKITRFQVL